MKFYSKFINFIKNKNIKNFPLIEVIVNDKQTKSWDCFFQIEEYPEEITHFNIFEKEFKDFFLKQLSEDLENFVELQPIINVHFRILDWNLLKDDYIWKKHYQYMLDKIVTNLGIDIDKKLIFFFQNTPILDLNTKKCLFKIENKIEEMFDISELKLKMNQLKDLFMKFYNFNFDFDFEFLQFDKDVIAEKTVHQYKDFSNNLSKNNKNIPLFNFQDIPIFYDEMFLFYKKFPQIILQGYIQFVIDNDKYGTFWISFYLVDPISCQDSILVKKFLSNVIKSAQRERDNLINVLR
ncbi:MAG: hypothetical protein Q8871_02350, partial [Pigeon pea little leaf phytoplasma]|nr:hypothetical protein [Pigeon pea little leaf phytoplasma]